MTHALLYQPKANWRTAAAFVAALLIHFAAIAFAATQQGAEVNTPVGEPESPVIDLTPSPPADEPAPPPDQPEPLSNPIAPDPATFPEEAPTPVPVHRQPNKPAVPIVKTKIGQSSGSLSISQARVMALSAPRPEYPYEARRQKVTGTGVVAMTIDPAGNVTSAVMERSTGNLILDNAAVAAFRRWHFKPGMVTKVKSPITFTMSGALY